MKHGLFLASITVGLSLTSHAEVSYNRDIRPILSDKCFACHGPDEVNNQAKLRLDTPEAAYAALKESTGHAIVPKDLEKSIAWQRIISLDPEKVMPPPESNLSLSREEKSLVKEWIEAGAQYEKHWAFESLAEWISIPETEQANWPQNPIDSFILSRLEKERLSPSPEAEPLRWLRRVTFDLTGLPPTLEEIEKFEQNPSKEDAVERLLASPAWGEHMAVAWLDAARYADSYGYQSDKLNNQWPYRDWVVNAFNRNLPYDQFLTEQLAGDLLPNPKQDQKLATAFNRIHRVNNEGGAIFEEWRTENIADRVHTFGTSVLGLTMECSRCHDHKYDPISMADYYSLFAFFNSIDENGMYDRTEKVPSPSLLLPSTLQKAQYEEARTRMREAEQALASHPASEVAPTTPFTSPDTLAMIDFGESEQKGWRFAQEDRSKSDPLPIKEGALVLNGDRGILVEKIEPFDRWTPFTVQVRLKRTAAEKEKSVIAHHCRGTDAGFNGWDLVAHDGHLETRLYRVWPGNAIGIRTTKKVPLNQWITLTVTYDGSSQAKGLKIHLDGQEMATEVLRDDMQKRVSVKVQHGGEFVLGYRWRDRGLKGGLVDWLRIESRALTPGEIAGSPNALSQRSAFDPDYRARMAALTATRRAFVMAEEVMNEVPIMKELPEPRTAYILDRGEYNAPKTPDKIVPRATLSQIGPAFPANAPRNRLGLAQWALDPTHPLTARVFVNRMWARFFGRGLVTTPENFGLQGALPSHPNLLDWLARDFISHGWDIKRLARQIVLSATYGQNSSGSRSLDPENILLARGPAYRLGAEEIRDLALAASGLLNRKAGGPPVSPYQPGEDLWRESNGMSPPYEQSVGKDLHRRSLYSVWKRTVPLPNMMAFDATAREVCSVARSRTNTPMQALVLLNDIQFVEAARALAQHVLMDEKSPIHTAFRSLTGRTPDETETQALEELFASQEKHYQSHPEEAAALISVGESSIPAEIPATRLAALTTVCQAILNLDATIWKR